MDSASTQEEKKAAQAAKDLSKELDVAVDPAFGHPDFGTPMCWFLRAWCDESVILPSKWEDMPVVRRGIRR